MPLKEKKEKSWLTVQAVADALNITIQGFYASYRKHVPEHAVREEKGHPMMIHFRSLFDAVIDFRVEEAKAKCVGEDAILAGGGGAGDSPALEQVRYHEARIRKVKADEAERTHMSLEALEAGMQLLGQIFKRGGEQLRRQHGNGPADALEEMIDEYAGELGKFFDNLRQRAGDAAAVGGEPENAPAADDAGVRGAGDHPAHRPL